MVILAVTSTCFALPFSTLIQEKTTNTRVINEIMPILNTTPVYDASTLPALINAKQMLMKESPALNSAVINKVLSTLKCTLEYNTGHSNILAVIDYSLPSSDKRLWVFNLSEQRLLFHTYVSHGIKSGALLSNYFSNKNDSKATSIGVYKTENTYYGRHGLSLKLNGLDRGFNDNAYNRSVVVHGGWYVEERFIKKYGRAGRSWGCPAVPESLTQPIINTIKDNALIVMYYPNDNWLLTSKFLNCDNFSSSHTKPTAEAKTITVEKEFRDDIFFADINKNNKYEENEPIAVMTADNYTQLFKHPAPLERMLRRPVKDIEYIALSTNEVNQLINEPDKSNLHNIYFVIPEIKMVHGYYGTEMKFVNLGNIKDLQRDTAPTAKTQPLNQYAVYFETKPTVHLKPTHRFIRWLGL